MMDGFSPLTRRFVAFGLLFVAALSLWNLVISPLWQLNMDQLDALGAARTRLARTRALASTEPPKVLASIPGDAVVIAPTRDAAISTIVGTLSASASRFNLTSPALTITPIGGRDNDRKLVVEVTIAARETDIVGFLGDVELGTPGIRFQTWRIYAPDAPGLPAKLEARAVGIWEVRK